MNRRRRKAALSFLNNISVNGQPGEDHRLNDKAKDPTTGSQIRDFSQTGSSMNQPTLIRARFFSVTCLRQTSHPGDPQEDKSSLVISREPQRIVLISVRRALYGMISVLPHRDLSQITDERLDSSCQKSFIGASLKDSVTGPDDAELGDKEKHSGSQFNPIHDALSQTGIKRRIKGKDIVYDPNLLDDPQWTCGKHKRVLVFPSYMTTVFEYVKQSDLKKDMNETFSPKFPHVQLTLSKIRSQKREICKLAQEDCGYDEPTIAMALVYFEKLALQGTLDKQNRKLCAGSCILLAAKISNDLKRPDVKHLIDRLEERLRLNRRELLALEFPVLVALEFKLHLPRHEILPHYRRLLKTTKVFKTHLN